MAGFLDLSSADLATMMERSREKLRRSLSREDLATRLALRDQTVRRLRIRVFRNARGRTDYLEKQDARYLPEDVLDALLAMNPDRPREELWPDEGYFLTSDDAADFLNIHPVTLRTWRAEGLGPAYVKVGGSVRYRPEDLTPFKHPEGLSLGDADACVCSTETDALESD